MIYSVFENSENVGKTSANKGKLPPGIGLRLMFHQSLPYKIFWWDGSKNISKVRVKKRLNFKQLRCWKEQTRCSNSAEKCRVQFSDSNFPNFLLFFLGVHQFELLHIWNASPDFKTHQLFRGGSSKRPSRRGFPLDSTWLLLFSPGFNKVEPLLNAVLKFQFSNDEKPSA